MVPDGFVDETVEEEEAVEDKLLGGRMMSAEDKKLVNVVLLRIAKRFGHDPKELETLMSD